MGYLGRRKKHKNNNIVSIHIDDQNCWVCGSKSEQKHHGLPKMLKPIHNIFIPVCSECHDKINMIKESYSPKTSKEKKDGT